MNFTAINFIGIFACAAVITLVMTPFTIWFAKKTGAIDVPTEERKIHSKPIPRIGGMAIFLGVTIAILVAVGLGFCDVDPEKFDITRKEIYGIIISGTVMFLLGLLDDYINLSPIVKLLGQIGVASMVFAFGIRLDFVSNFIGETTFTGFVGYLVTVIWIVGVTNTINLVDGLDGLAAGIVAIASLAIAYVAYIFGYYSACFPLLAIAGGCLGFLPFNFFPAKTFMGDSGSLFLGMMISSFALLQPVKSTTVVAVIIPSLVLSLPLFDTLFAIVRRMVNHKPIMEADKEHIHHRLMKAGLGQIRTVLCMYGICGIMSIAAIMVARELYKETTGLVVIAIMYIYIVLTDPNRRAPHIRKTDKD